MLSVDAESFWDFSVRTYRTANVPDACLSLQDQHGIDVNMLLYCCWIAGCYGDFDDALWNRSIAFSSAWSDNLVKPLRSARTWMKNAGCSDPHVPTDACMRFREEVKLTEFSAEKMQQEVLQSFVENPRYTDSNPTMLVSASKNLLHYFAHLGIIIDTKCVAELVVIIQAAYPQFGEEDIVSQLGATEVS